MPFSNISNIYQIFLNAFKNLKQIIIYFEHHFYIQHFCMKIPPDW